MSVDVGPHRDPRKQLPGPECAYRKYLYKWLSASLATGVFPVSYLLNTKFKILFYAIYADHERLKL